MFKRLGLPFRRPVTTSASAGPPPAKSEVSLTPCDPTELVESMLDQDRWALLLRPQVAAHLSPRHLDRATEEMRRGMSLVPGGDVELDRWQTGIVLLGPEIPRTVVQVDAVWLDRCAVSNRQFFEFVRGGGYSEAFLWDETIWPRVGEFVDRSGQPGPRFWAQGCFARGEEDFPVSGISLYEADAYAHWVGKRLPTGAEWVKAGAWPVCSIDDKRLHRRYPWGDGFRIELAHLWTAGKRQPLAVDAHPEGASAGGLLQMIGNVWEWTASPFEPWLDGEPATCSESLVSIRGGAFDTYFDFQADVQMQSGESPLARLPNLGFRCAIGASELVLAAHPKDNHTEAPA